MALVLPSPTDLQRHREDVSDADALQQAADLFTLASGVTDTPVDPLEARLVQIAILDMAWYLQTVHEDLEEVFSPFSSERIGSYSYSKMAAATAAKTQTGVPGFDAAVAYFAARGNADLFAIDTEWVFQRGVGFGGGSSPTNSHHDPGLHYDIDSLMAPSPPPLESDQITLDADGNVIIDVG